MIDLEVPFIPCVRTSTDADAVKASMPNAKTVQVPGYRLASVSPSEGWDMWIDTGFDAFDYVFDKGFPDYTGKGESIWFDWIQEFEGHEILRSERTFANAGPDEVYGLVAPILDNLSECSPSVLSVPQVPYDQKSTRHNINKKLAKATARWKQKKNFDGDLVLPVILTTWHAYKRSAARTAKVNAIKSAYTQSGASGVWVVHAGFEDYAGREKYGHNEFPSLMEFHVKLAEKLPKNASMWAGPYWAINLILWAQGKVHAPVVPAGGPITFRMSTPYPRTGRPRIAIPPLLRWHAVVPELKTWIRDARVKYESSSTQYRELNELERHFGDFRKYKAAKIQTAEFYHDWVLGLEKIDPDSRPLYLFQQFTQAMVNGDSVIRLSLPNVSEGPNYALKPGEVAKQFMLQCL